MKQFVGIIAQTKILQSIEKVVAGTASKAEIEYLAANGIDANMAERIWRQFAGGPGATSAKAGPAVHADAPPSAARRMAGEPIRYTGREFGGDALTTPIGKLKALVRDFARNSFAGRTFRNTGDGADIIVPWSSIKKATQDQVARNSLLATARLDELIQRGAHAGSRADRGGRHTIKAYHYYDSAVEIAGQPTEVRVVVRELEDGRRYYDHYEMKSGGGPTTGGSSREAGGPIPLDGEPPQSDIGAAGAGVKDGAIWWANTEAWTDRQAIEGMRAALVRDIDRVIVTPGQDKPLWMSTPLGKVIGQFRSFNIASMQRTVIAGLQQRDAATLNGALLMLALGALSYKLKMETAGYEVSDDPAVWAAEAFDRSGLAGWIMDANNIAEKTALRPATIAGLTGVPASRYASRNVFGALFGPTADLLGDVVPLGTTGEWSASDTHVIRKLIPMQNLFYLRQLFDKVEAGANEAFGVPARKEKR
jgi:hypothetical protein